MAVPVRFHTASEAAIEWSGATAIVRLVNARPIAVGRRRRGFFPRPTPPLLTLWRFLRPRWDSGARTEHGGVPPLPRKPDQIAAGMSDSGSRNLTRA
jgi:hypothetical protein